MFDFCINLFTLFYSLLAAVNYEIFYIPVLLICLAYLIRLIYSIMFGRVSV